jgi:hypothetical protein
MSMGTIQFIDYAYGFIVVKAVTYLSIGSTVC